MHILPRLASDRTPRSRRAISVVPSRSAGRDAWPLPRELAEAPAWLLDDLGLCDAGEQIPQAEQGLLWHHLVRRLG